MWERFPPRMRKALTGALEAAGRLGHEEAKPEHLLLAIADDEECAAAFMLERSGISADRLKEELEPRLEKRPARLQRAGAISSSLMHVLDVAAGEADRARDRHVGTEHVALALTRINSNLASEVLAKLAFNQAAADAAMERWRKEGMPRRRPGLSGLAIGSPVLRKIVAPIERVARVPVMGWNVFVRKSLGHPKFATNPYPLYRWLREREPVRKDPLAPVWVITRYDDTMLMLRDPRFKKDPFASQRLPKTVREQLAVPLENVFRASVETVSMLFLDPPEHTRIRSIFTKAFTPRRLENLRERIQLICDKRLDRVAASGRMELMGDLAAPLPVTVIAELLGFPPEDYQKIKKWSDDMAEALALNPSGEAQGRAAEARDALRVYFDDVVKQIEAKPGDNLLSALLAPDVDVLNRDELFTNSILLLAAGHETTTHLIGNAIYLLLKHPEQLAAVRAKPELLEGAIEEVLRYEAPVQWTSRVAGEDIELRGERIKRGDIVLASVGAANRDPEVFEDPETFNIYRTENRHLSFGAGSHFCLGAALARMEATIAIGTILRRFPELQVERTKLKWQKGLTFRGLKALPLRF
ncbi:MAG TPA: cytochrome P450 [Tepidisphaeraceae bacterium]